MNRMPVNFRLYTEVVFCFGSLVKMFDVCNTASKLRLFCSFIWSPEVC